jgi:hypothetical protein
MKWRHPKHLEIGGRAQSADKQRQRGGVVMAYLLDTYELQCHWTYSIVLLWIQNIAGDVTLEKCKEIGQLAKNPTSI